MRVSVKCKVMLPGAKMMGSELLATNQESDLGVLVSWMKMLTQQQK